MFKPFSKLQFIHFIHIPWIPNLKFIHVLAKHNTKMVIFNMVLTCGPFSISLIYGFIRSPVTILVSFHRNPPSFTKTALSCKALYNGFFTIMANFFFCHFSSHLFSFLSPRTPPKGHNLYHLPSINSPLFFDMNICPSRGLNFSSHGM